jgi:hypothetical protein
MFDTKNFAGVQGFNGSKCLKAEIFCLEINFLKQKTGCRNAPRSLFS